MDKSITRKNYIWNTIGSTLYSFNSFFFLIIVTRINGLIDAGIFSIAFATATIINKIAVYSGRTYQLSDDNKKISENSYIAFRLVSSVISILLLFGYLFINDYSFEKNVIFIFLSLLKALEAFDDVFYGMLHKRNKLYIAGKSNTYKSLLGLILFFIIDIFTKNLVLSCFVLLVFNIIFMIIYDIKNVVLIMDIKFIFRIDDIIELFKKSFYVFLFNILILIIINVPKYGIDYFLNEKDQAIYGFISMPATFMMLFGQFIIQPSLYSMVKCVNEERYVDFNKIILRISLAIFGCMILVLPLAYVLGIPVLNLVYGQHLEAFRIDLLIIIIGAGFYAISNVFLNALIILKCTKEQIYLQIISLVISIISVYYFTGNYGLFGSVICYFIVLTSQFILYLLLYAKIIKNRKERVYEKNSAN